MKPARRRLAAGNATAGRAVDNPNEDGAGLLRPTPPLDKTAAS